MKWLIFPLLMLMFACGGNADTCEANGSYRFLLVPESPACAAPAPYTIKFNNAANDCEQSGEDPVTGVRYSITCDPGQDETHECDGWAQRLTDGCWFVVQVNRWVD